MLSISENKRNLLKDGSPFFYLADTCWSAFTNISESEWKYYLIKRKAQGFNVLQINVLAQWDRSRNDHEILPFNENNGIFDFCTFNDEYFERAHKMCEEACSMGFTLSLIVLWSNYVIDTWASDMDNGKNIISEIDLNQYFTKVIDYFDKFSPIYVIGGDTDFPSDRTVKTYLSAFNYFNNYSPDTLKTIHIKGRYFEIPEVIKNEIDFYFYQSGHNVSYVNMPYSLANIFYDLEPKKPIINAEPCYEQMGYARRVYGRFTQRDVRQAAWQSVLSGASAGITYGAHGIWSWQSLTSDFSEEIGEAFDSPLLWQDALNLDGANDYGYLSFIFKFLKITNVIPFNEVLVNGDESIRIGRNENSDIILIYLPSNTKFNLKINLEDYNIHLIDLNSKNILIPKIKFNNTTTTFFAHSCPEDVLYIIRKEVN